MAEFQQVVYGAFAAGLPGELAADGPLRAQSFRLNANGSVPIAFGSAFTYDPAGDVGNPSVGGSTLAVTQQAIPGGAGAFAGILINPKSHALYGTAAGALTPVYTLPDGSWGELCTMGILFASVLSVAAALPGAQLYFDPATGGVTTATSGTLIPGAFLNTGLGANAAPQLARITLTGNVPAAVAP